jgi:cytidylate kinase
MVGKTPQIVIAIDGPAASGKSITARGVAKKLGYRYIDTGAMYRTITVKVLKKGIDLNDTDAISGLVQHTTVSQQEVNGEPRFLLDGVDVTDQLRTPEVNRNVSPVSEVPAVRQRMVAIQQESGRDGGVVLEGRDIGTVVFPNAELKIYLIADPKERARRRMLDLCKQDVKQDIETVLEDLETRDTRDSSRQLSPLRKAEDARDLDTTSLTIDQQVDIIVSWAREIIARKHETP